MNPVPVHSNTPVLESAALPPAQPGSSLGVARGAERHSPGQILPAGHLAVGAGGSVAFPCAEASRLSPAWSAAPVLRTEATSRSEPTTARERLRTTEGGTSSFAYRGEGESFETSAFDPFGRIELVSGGIFDTFEPRRRPVFVPGEGPSELPSRRVRRVVSGVLPIVGRLVSVGIALAGLLGIGWSAYRQPTFHKIREEAFRAARALSPDEDGLWLQPVTASGRASEVGGGQGSLRASAPPLSPPAFAARLAATTRPRAVASPGAKPGRVDARAEAPLGTSKFDQARKNASRQRGSISASPARKNASAPPVRFVGLSSSGSAPRQAPVRLEAASPALEPLAFAPRSAPLAAPAPVAPGAQTRTRSGAARQGKRAHTRRPPRAASQVRVVDLNRARASELTQLPGIGPKRAQAILALRSRLGRFRHPADLLRVRGIGVRTLQRIRPYLALTP